MQSSCLWMGLLLLLLAAAQGQGQSQTHSSGEHFEDADKSSEYTDQQFDLRHTIPGEPGLDYPILSTPPKTSFVCKGRHEGYYADVESRCQAFRICAHTARSPQGFGFLCPNGTLFSQKNFVCDWYRNVICDDSERYYDMNAANTVGSTHEMMERVRHMMEYPMKTITKALQQAQTHSQTSPQQQQHHHQHQSLSKDLSSVSGVLTHPAEAGEPQIAAGRGEEIKSEPLNAAGLETISTSISSDDDGEGIYVNSLGELSSDPGIQFDHTNAHIVAEYPREYHYQKQKNFAERVNAGLEVLADTESTSSEVLAPDYMKHIRSNKDEATQVDLVSNINNLLDEVSSDADPSVSGYQSMAPHKIKQPFRFLSRGFAMHGDGSKGSSSAYVYNKPKQTPGTVRFTNFKSVQAKGSAQFQQHRPLTKTSSIGSRSSSGSGRNSIGYSKPPTAPAISSLTVPPRPSQLPQPALPTQPGIVIVRAEGQRIAPNSASNIIASLATQAPPKATQGNSYVSLNDFFSSKFGQGNANSVAGATTLQQQQQAQVQRQPAQQQHYGQQQLQQVQQQQHHHVQVQQQVQRQQQPQQQSNYITQQYQQPSQNIYQPNIYQQQSHSYQQQQQQHNPFQQQQQQQFHQQARPSIQTNQQPYLTPNIFVPYQQQQQQLPQFPPLAPPAPVTATGSVQGSFIGGRHVDHLNVQLPTLANGLIPGLQLAQKRSDVSAHQLQLTDTGGRHPASSGSGKSRERSFYSGRTSYQVPQSSVGRLPNDITQQLRGRHRRY
ncbi:putative uncharacterized protein DDB_G0268364 isoform X2 [Drosophila pseudoobscura]|uniref:Chitin-binding type-2 domain-containing protein n=1 Tax=Drosophila pseudoobscura pseudoobscura TaxID=46245 RepID=A0A6I8VWD9_DROPS|nr:putative uncharacterized protein DDB_G0268364 isoform X2 [Drosophila pseudoobscura]